MIEKQVDINQTFKRLTRILCELTSNPEHEIDPDFSLQNDLSINLEDSLDELAFIINKEFMNDGILVTSDELLDEFEKYGDTVTTLVALIQERFEFD